MTLRGMPVAALVAVISTGATSQPQQAEPVVGFVRVVEGTWQVRSRDGATTRVARGQTVPGGATLLAIAGERPRIVISRAYGSELSSCVSSGGGPEECVKVLALPDVPAPTPFVRRMWMAVGRFFSAPESTFVETLSRGGSLRDGVVPVRGDTLDLVQVVRLPPGTYRAELTASDSSANAGTKHQLIVIQTETGSRADAPKGLGTGVYTLTLLDTAESTHILVGPAKLVADAFAGFRELDRASAEWSMDQIERRGIRRALLHEYAREIDPDFRR